MQFSLLKIKSSNQFLIKTFSDKNSSEYKTINIEELINTHTNAIFFTKEILQESSIFNELEEKNKQVPVNETDLSDEEFINLGFSEAHGLYVNSQRSWILQNNLNLLENLFNYRVHLKKLWANDRTSFFEEFWNIIKNNLGATNLKIIYNSIKKAEKENEKNKLIQVIIEGDVTPNSSESNELGKEIMDNFKPLFNDNNYQVLNFDKEKTELTLLLTINEGPIVLMANVNSYSPLQNSLLKSFVESLQ